MARYNVLARVAFACFALMTVSACSSVEIMHSMADDVLKSRVSSLLDLSEPDDERHVRETVDDFFDKATPKLVPVYAEYLNKQALVLETAGADTTRDDVADMVNGMRQLLRKSAIDIAPSVANVLIRHTSSERVAHLREALAEQREERIEKRQAGTMTERREDRIDRLSENIERFIPDLTAAQMAAIAAYVDADMALDDEARFFEYTERRHEALAEFLATQPTETEIAAYMVSWMVEGPQLTDPAFVPEAEAWWDGRTDLFWSVIRLMDEEQRARTIRIVREYATDIMGLL